MRAAGKQLTRCIACALALVFHCVPAIGSAPLQLPTTPLQNYYVEQHAMGAQSSEALAWGLLYCAERAPEDRRMALAEQAALAAPSLAEPHLYRARCAIRRFDVPSALLALRDASEALASSAVQSATWSLRLQSFVIRSLSAALLALAFLLVLRIWPFLQHQAAVRSRSPGAVLMAVFSLALLAVLSFPLLASLVLLAMIAPILARGERAALALLCILFAVAVWILQWQQPEALLADPGHRLHQLARANIETLPATRVRDLETQLAASREREVVLGLQASRRQQWHRAHQHFVEALAQDSTWATTYVNLANVFFALSDFERAATGYRKAQSLDANSPLPHANLAQAYIQMLQYEQSDHELRTAASLGFEADAASPFAWRHESQPVVDALLSRGDLRRLAQAAIVDDPQAARLRLASWFGPGWNAFHMQWMPWVLLATAVWFLLRIRLSSLAFECAECKRVICRHCVPASSDSGHFCPRCEAIATRRSGHSIGDGTPASRRPSHAQTADKASDAIAVLFPGAAYLLLRSPVMAIGTILLACACMSLASPWLATATFLSLYLPGLLRLRHKPRSLGV